MEVHMLSLCLTYFPHWYLWHLLVALPSPHSQGGGTCWGWHLSFYFFYCN